MKKLNLEQMEDLQAGVSAKEYCGTVHMIYANNPGQKGTEGMNYALSLCNGLGYPYRG